MRKRRRVVRRAGRGFGASRILGFRVSTLALGALGVWLYRRHKAGKTHPALAGAAGDSSRVRVASDNSRWYPPMTDGDFLDLLDELKAAGATTTGSPPVVQLTFLGTLATLVHDVEGGVRVVIVKADPHISEFWKQTEAAIKVRTTATKEALEEALRQAKAADDLKAAQLRAKNVVHIAPSAKTASK